MAKAFQPVGLGQHVHRVERLDIAASGQGYRHHALRSSGAGIQRCRAAQMPE